MRHSSIVVRASVPVKADLARPEPKFFACDYKKLGCHLPEGVKNTDTRFGRQRCFGGELAGAFAEDNDFGCLQQHQKVQEQALVLDVVQVKFQLIECVIQ